MEKIKITFSFLFIPVLLALIWGTLKQRDTSNQLNELKSVLMADLTLQAEVLNALSEALEENKKSQLAEVLATAGTSLIERVEMAKTFYPSHSLSEKDCMKKLKVNLLKTGDKTDAFDPNFNVNTRRSLVPGPPRLQAK